MDFYAGHGTMWVGFVNDNGAAVALRLAGWQRDGQHLLPMCIYTDDIGRFAEVAGAPETDIWFADSYEAALWAAENNRLAELFAD
ncbi:hypothetical protein [Dactylosporangium darangshiense]|uniref:Uncharacterized protein n=1 Tax=Dactylosporangium darangshiense TaxID=579108 RepID=A0ABP8DMJ3_9ACTN